MPTPTIPLSQVVDITVQISPQLPSAPTFNQGLIIGNSAVIPYTTKIVSFASLASILTYGFTTSDPEYIAADLYFSQSPSSSLVWIALQNTTGILAGTIDVAGTGYTVGNVVTIVQGGASLGTFEITAATAGVPSAIALVTSGTSYTAATGLSTTGGSGTGLTITITVGQSLLQAAIEASAASSSWYGLYCCGAVDADIEAIAAWVQGNVGTDPMLFCYNTADAAALSGASGNIFAYLKNLSYNRSIGIYSTTQSSVYPNNAYAGAAVMGMLLGLNTGLANSQFTAKFKPLVGIAPEPIILSQVQIIENNNGNVYVVYQYGYQWFEQGVVSNGQFVDEVMGLDYLIAGIQVNVADLLVSEPSIPQTNAGEQILINAVAQACDAAVTRGYIALGGGGVPWQGQQILNLVAGDPLPLGYLIQAQSYALQSPSNRAARQAMPIYVAIIEAGAVHFVTIGIYVQR